MIKIGITDNTVDNKNEYNDDKISNKTDKSVRLYTRQFSYNKIWVTNTTANDKNEHL